jgi:hypothetical protein
MPVTPLTVPLIRAVAAGDAPTIIQFSVRSSQQMSRLQTE